MERYFAPCPRGLEAALGDELKRLDASSIAPVDGGVGFEGPLDLARPLMLARVPENVLLHLAVLVAYALAAYYVALVLTRRRLLK